MKINIPEPCSNEKFIVFWTCLLPLLKTCKECASPATINKVVRKDTLVIVQLFCSNGHQYEWHSQPNLYDMASGNVILAASLQANTFWRIKDKKH